MEKWLLSVMQVFYFVFNTFPQLKPVGNYICNPSQDYIFALCNVYDAKRCTTDLHGMWIRFVFQGKKLPVTTEVAWILSLGVCM